MSSLLCPSNTRHLLWCMELAMLSWCQHLGQDCSLHTFPQYWSSQRQWVTLSLSSPTSAPTPGITHPKPKSACTSSTAGRWAACHSQINPHQTDTREDKNNWLAGKCLVQSWMNDSATLEQKEECLPTQADKSFRFVQKRDCVLVHFLSPDINL